LTPSSTARRKTFFAFSRSGGQPQIPSPVSRIAPKPRRLTNRSPPNKNVSSLLLALAAVISFGNPPVRTPAAPAEIVPKKVLRLIAGKIRCRDQRSTLNHQQSTGFDLPCSITIDSNFSRPYSFPQSCWMQAIQDREELCARSKVSNGCSFQSLRSVS
jgi:hypothetical protein